MISFFEICVSLKYLFPKTREKFFSLITLFSFLGICLGVATLIIVMSVMNGFRVELTPKPLGIYGKSKAKGEEYLLKLKNNYVVRTSWLYGDFGKNFCLTMLRLHKEKSLAKQPLRVVSDQIGSPTSTYSLSRFCWKIIDSLSKSKIIPSLLHWSDAGVASWFDFAFAIGEIGVEKGLISEAAKVIPIKSNEYKTPAKRPHFSLLNCEESTKILKANQFHWRVELKKVMEEIKLKNLK